MRTILTILAALTLTVTASAKTQPDYSLTVHVTAVEHTLFGSNNSFRAEFTEHGQTYIVSGISVRGFQINNNSDYPARRARHDHRDSFQIQTPDGRGHWFEIDAAREGQ